MNTKYDHIVRFIAWVFPNESDSVYQELLITDIPVGITSELAEKSGHLFSNHANVPSLNVYVAPEVFQKSITNITGLNHTAQIVRVLRLLEDWEASGFPLYINKTVFHPEDTK